MVGKVLRWSWLPLVGIMTSCIFSLESTDDEPEPWSAEILAGTHHVGTEVNEDWPPPGGDCIQGKFTLEDLPVDPGSGATAREVSLVFQHDGERKGLVEINGTTVFRRVTLVDDVVDVFADAIVAVTVCAVASMFPGDPECDEIELDIETTGVARAVSTEDLTIGTNEFRVCATDGDFLIADGLELYEIEPSEDQTGSDAGTGFDAGDLW